MRHSPHARHSWQEGHQTGSEQAVSDDGSFGENCNGATYPRDSARCRTPGWTTHRGICTQPKVMIANLCTRKLRTPAMHVHWLLYTILDIPQAHVRRHAPTEDTRVQTNTLTETRLQLHQHPACHSMLVPRWACPVQPSGPTRTARESRSIGSAPVDYWATLSSWLPDPTPHPQCLRQRTCWRSQCDGEPESAGR